MIAISLQSGSNGNCIYVEAGGTKVLFDAGISGITAESRLAAHGRDIRDVDALIISHDHADHVRCAGIYQRKYGIPLYVTERTLDATESRIPLGRLNDVRFFVAGETLMIGELAVGSYRTPHDGEDGSVFIVENGAKRLGIMTDLGHSFDGLQGLVASLDGVFIESNYDPAMLARGPYPAFLKRRIAGPGGHLSNRESAELLRCAAEKRLQWACLAHLSEQNNAPEVALKTHRYILGEALPLAVAGRYAPSRIFRI